MKTLFLYYRYKIKEARLLAAILIGSLLLFFGFTGSLEAVEKTFPFYPGEKLTFQLKWTFIPAGTAVLEVLPIETINGKKVYHFVMTAKSNSFIDHFYKVRDRIDAYTDLQMAHSVLYKKNQLEGKTHREILVRFDWEKKEARYSNFGKKKKPISILPGSFDPLSIFYYSRLLFLKENTTVKAPVTDGKKCVIGQSTVIRREIIEIGGVTYDTFLLEPELKHIGGVFEKSKEAKIKLWVTADKRRIPVKIESKVIVGSFIGELIASENNSKI